MAEGSVTKRKRKDGSVRWQARLDLGKDAAGKRRRKMQDFVTRKEAVAALTAWRADAASGRAVLVPTGTVRAYLAQWIVSKQSIEASTRRDYQFWIEKHITPHLGDLQLAVVTTQILERWRDTLLAAGLSPRSVIYCLGLVNQAFERAVRVHRLLPYNPAEHVELPKRERQRVVTWQVQEAQQFLSAVGADPLYALWLLALTSGMRRGELAGLRWQDVDLDRGLAHVVQARKLAWGTAYEGSPKSDTSQRTVVLDGVTRTALLEHEVRQADRARCTQGWRDTGYVFTYDIGTPLHPDLLSHRFRALCDGAGVPHVCLHSLRHTAAALALLSGANIKVVSQRLGHSRTAITLDLYAYTFAGQDEQAADGVATPLFGAAQSARHPGVTLETEKQPQ